MKVVVFYLACRRILRFGANKCQSSVDCTNFPAPFNERLTLGFRKTSQVRVNMAAWAGFSEEELRKVKKSARNDQDRGLKGPKQCNQSFYSP